jgi:hypothetical protein
MGSASGARIELDNTKRSFRDVNLRVRVTDFAPSGALGVIASRAGFVIWLAWVVMVDSHRFGPHGERWCSLANAVTVAAPRSLFS